jgi:Uma2 family endonuclease
MFGVERSRYTCHMQINLEPPYLIVKPGISEEEFYRVADEDSDWEYLDGRILMHSLTSDQHENLFRFLLTLLSAYLDEKRGAVVRGSRYPMRLDANWSPEPDILVVREHRRQLMTPRRLEGPADMVIEIVSESDPGLDYREKLPRYRQAGIEEIWIINPFENEILAEVNTLTGYATQVLSSGRLESKVLSGFWIEVSWLWQEELPSTLACLREIMQ